MALSPLAGKPAPESMLIDVSKLERLYYAQRPDPSNPAQRVLFGTSGHRGTPGDSTFTETHILAITQAIAEYRKSQKISGPLFIGKDTHALSGPAQKTALEVLSAQGVETVYQKDDGVTPTPIISHAILNYNRDRYETKNGLADGIVITPSHNPPEDGGFKYNPPDGGPADTTVTSWIEKRANELLATPEKIARTPYERVIRSPGITSKDFAEDYINDLDAVIDMSAIRDSGLNLGVDPLGGASVHYWEPIAAQYGLKITVTNKTIDPTFGFMTVDHDGKIRMDCSSPYAMAKLVSLKDQYDLAFGNDPDSDRHGIVAPSSGLMNPNNYLAVAIHYLLQHRPQWSARMRIGKTIVSSSMIDRVVAALKRSLAEVPVGFKWFAPRLFDRSYCFGGEESAGASFLRRDGTPWSTDKDGIIMDLLAAEITAVTGSDPGRYYHTLTAQFGSPRYVRIDAPATGEQKEKLKKLSPDAVSATSLAGEKIIEKLTKAPGNNAEIGGLKVTTEHGWFAARPSGTEEIYKIYAESFKNQAHLDRIVDEAKKIVEDAFTK